MSRLICVRRYYDPEEALVVCGALQAAGIDTFLFNAPFLASFPDMRVAVGGYRLLVSDHAKDAAESELAALESFAPDKPIGADDPCSNCGGVLFRRQRSLRWGLIAFLYGSAFAAQTRQSRCLACGEVVGEDDRPMLVRLFFLVLSAALILWYFSGWIESMFEWRASR